MERPSRDEQQPGSRDRYGGLVWAAAGNRPPLSESEAPPSGSGVLSGHSPATAARGADMDELLNAVQRAQSRARASSEGFQALALAWENAVRAAVRRERTCAQDLRRAKEECWRLARQGVPAPASSGSSGPLRPASAWPRAPREWLPCSAAGSPVPCGQHNCGCGFCQATGLAELQEEPVGLELVLHVYPGRWQAFGQEEPAVHAPPTFPVAPGSRRGLTAKLDADAHAAAVGQASAAVHEVALRRARAQGARKALQEFGRVSLAAADSGHVLGLSCGSRETVAAVGAPESVGGSIALGPAGGRESTPWHRLGRGASREPSGALPIAEEPVERPKAVSTHSEVAGDCPLGSAFPSALDAGNSRGHGPRELAGMDRCGGRAPSVSIRTSEAVECNRHQPLPMPELLDFSTCSLGATVGRNSQTTSACHAEVLPTCSRGQVKYIHRTLAQSRRRAGALVTLHRLKKLTVWRSLQTFANALVCYFREGLTAVWTSIAKEEEPWQALLIHVVFSWQEL